MEKFNNYQFSDFLNDDSFIRLVKYNLKEEREKWLNWVSSKPANLQAYEDAYAYLVTVYSAVTVEDDSANKQQVWNNIEQGIVQQETRYRKIRRLKVLGYSVAASLFFALCGAWFYESKIIITTTYGQQLSVVLPDHSTIKLNANSELSYYRAWNWHKDREVWLKGEALFEVKHVNQNPQQIKNGERFFAHAGTLRVEVLGTTFNVKYRRNAVQVALIKGKIGLQQAGLTTKPLLLNTGEAVEYNNNRFNKIRVIDLTNKPLAWQERRMVVSGMTVGGIIENYEDTYGGRIVLDNEALRSKEIDGTISLQTRESTLYMLANILNATVEKQGDNFYLKSK